MFLDLADAFGSIDHEMMVDALRAYGYPEIIINLTKDIYIVCNPRFRKGGFEKI